MLRYTDIVNLWLAAPYKFRAKAQWSLYLIFRFVLICLLVAIYLYKQTEIIYLMSAAVTIGRWSHV